MVVPTSPSEASTMSQVRAAISPARSPALIEQQQHHQVSFWVPGVFAEGQEVFLLFPGDYLCLFAGHRLV